MTVPSGNGGNVNYGADIPIFDDVFIVQPVGGAQRLIQMPPLGATISNLDTANGVWVSPSSSVQPGNGVFLGVGGSMTWGHPSEVPYACVDTGVTTPVLLTISTAAQNVQNPAVIAEAVALAITAQGIVTDLYSPPNTPPLPNTIPAFQTFPASSYQSVYIRLAPNFFPATTVVLSVQILFFDKGGQLINGEVVTVFSDASVTAPSVGGAAGWVMPCNADHFTVTPLGSTAGYLYVGASARPCPTDGLSIFGGNRGGPMQLTNKSALVANVPQYMVNTGTFETTVALNGLITISYIVSVAGTINICWGDGESFAIGAFPVQNVAIGSGSFQIVAPPVPIAFKYNATAAGAINAANILVSGVSG